MQRRREMQEATKEAGAGHKLNIAWDPIYEYPLPEGHRFPMAKYRLIPEQLLYEGTVSRTHFFSPSPLEEDAILLTHTKAYWEELKKLSISTKMARRIGLPLSRELVRREIIITQGTVKAAEFALERGIGMNISGGTHHAYADRGEGFCLLNDIAIAANVLLHKRLVKRVLVVDLDVHQGNGTAVLFQGKSAVFTFSMHCAANYPLEKEKSDLDIALPAGTGDREYLRILKRTLPELVRSHKPELIFYLSGVDVLETDKLGKLSLSKEGCRDRDEYVLQLCHREKIPVTVVMGGGYSPQLRTIIDAHCNTYRIAAGLYSD